LSSNHLSRQRLTTLLVETPQIPTVNENRDNKKPAEANLGGLCVELKGFLSPVLRAAHRANSSAENYGFPYDP
jgi:hypothetical protein